VGHVSTGYQEHKPHRAEQDQQSGPDVLDCDVFDGHYSDAPAAAIIWASLGDTLGNGIHFLGGLGKGDSTAEPGDNAEVLSDGLEPLEAPGHDNVGGKERPGIWR